MKVIYVTSVFSIAATIVHVPVSNVDVDNALMTFRQIHEDIITAQPFELHCDSYEAKERDVIIDQTQHLTGGGTKTPYQILGTQDVLLLPNERNLFRLWERVVQEEIQGSMFSQGLGVPTIDLELCYAHEKPYQQVPVLRSRSFASYPQDGCWILDRKNFESFQINSFTRWMQFFDYRNIENWMKLVTPGVLDLWTLAQRGFRAEGDRMNQVLCSPGGLFHSGNSDGWEIRMFIFDFASKKMENNFVDKPSLAFEDFLNEVAGYLEIIQVLIDRNSNQASHEFHYSMKMKIFTRLKHMFKPARSIWRILKKKTKI